MLDTNDPTRQFTYSLLGMLADHEQDPIRERTRLGLAEPPFQGKLPGRPMVFNQVQRKELD